MSSTMKWVVAAVVVAIIIVALWMGGVFGTGFSSQSAAAYSAISGDISNAAIVSDTLAIDAQLKAINPAGGAGVVAPQMKDAISALRALAKKLQSRIINAPPGSSVASMKSTLTDLQIQLQNASSQAGVAAATSTNVAQGKIYLQTGYADLLKARVDAGTIETMLNIK